MQQPTKTQTIAPARTGAELGALDIRRSELRRQLESNTERRSLLGVQLKESQGTPMQRALEARIQALDTRTARIDQEMNQIDDAISASLASGIRQERGPQPGVTVMPTMPAIPGMPPMLPGRDLKNAVANVMIFDALGFVLLGLFIRRMIRRHDAKTPVRLAAEESNRLEQLQRNVDVIALEVERISEGQRYVTKLLSEKQPALGAGAAQDIPAARRDAQPARKADTPT